MGFKSIFKAFRTSQKPGVRPSFNVLFTPPNYPVYETNENGDPLTDRYGVQWFRDANAPVQFRDSSNPESDNTGNLYKQIWDIAVAADNIVIGEFGGAGKPSAIFKIAATFGDPAIPWATSPYYLQVHVGVVGLPIPGGRVPEFVMPVPRPNEGVGQAYIDFGVNTPFNCVGASIGGATIAFSVTPNVFTSPGGVLGQINVNWAFYAYTP